MQKGNFGAGPARPDAALARDLHPCRDRFPSARSGALKTTFGYAVRAARALILTLAGVAACDGYPRDPEGTLERVSGGALRAGVSEAPPWLTRADDGSPAGPEAELIEAFARSVGAEVEWRWDGADELLEALERRQLDVVAAGLSGGSPWRVKVAFTRPWRVEGGDERILAVPPGENATLVALDRLIEARRRSDAP